MFMFLLFERGAFFLFFFFLLFGRGACFCFCCLGGWRVSFFAVWAGTCSFFAVWAGGVFFLLFGRGTGVHSLTDLPVCLARL